MIRVNNRVLDNDYDIEDRQRAVKIINCICDFINRGFYFEGHRNNIAVDLACACHVVEVDIDDLRDEALDLTPTNYLNLKNRIKAIKPYLHGWDVFGNGGVFDYMLYEFDWEGEENVKQFVVLENVNEN